MTKMFSMDSFGKAPDTAAFDAWMQKVNAVLEKRVGVGSDDLPDCCYSDWFEDGVSPARAAAKAVKAALGGDLY